MVHVAGRGLFDFSKFDPREKFNWTRLRLILREASKSAELHLYDMLHRQVVQQLSNSSLKGESLEKAWDSGLSLYNRSKALSFPWLEGKEVEDKGKKTYSAEEAWAIAYGDPNDPVIQAQIAATARWLESKSPKK